MNKSRLNPNKMEALLVRLDSALGREHTMILDGVAVHQKDHVHSLGVLALLLDVSCGQQRPCHA